MLISGTASKQSPFEAAACQESYRVADVELATCELHGGAAVLCSTAGKVGRNGRSAAVGATLFWLTCPYLNTMVARLERQGAVSALQRLVDGNARVAARHVASHARYEAHARALLSDERWTFFDAHFVSLPESAGGRKYGNAAVGHAKDLKCLHALVAQSLCGAPNPIGDAVLHYIIHLSKKVEELQHPARDPAPDKDEKAAEEDNAAPASVNSFDDISAFVVFVEGWTLQTEDEHGTLPVAVDASGACSAACKVLTFLEGRPPRHRKKHRIN
ncbi:hypothetical protein TraAM80_07971 [Trypanosoma rangeli]|uniref:Uncharacterized protein n=1 Tax=Trypanosoma rangeli TaxID=5698 RepID=A0A422N2V1_TRYRA|nr:uncharacterized protein TraAM80_07971 [Trypanosoma rangeli]RNE99783.1 hypothetical protein TraAM80_07971 [Trypanosoma rangeli]|eukprot:RNE99783.1 hypothetical protein TraAM80_07971 [Trypanosoma rangeli]